MTFKQLCNDMDAAELMEWVAFYNLQNEEYRNKIEHKVAEESSLEEQCNAIRGFLNRIKPTQKINVTKKEKLKYGS